MSSGDRLFLPHPPTGWKSKDAKPSPRNQPPRSNFSPKLPDFHSYKTESVCDEKDRCFLIKLVTTWLCLPLYVHRVLLVSPPVSLPQTSLRFYLPFCSPPSLSLSSTSYQSKTKEILYRLKTSSASCSLPKVFILSLCSTWLRVWIISRKSNVDQEFHRPSQSRLPPTYLLSIITNYNI